MFIPKSIEIFKGKAKVIDGITTANILARKAIGLVRSSPKEEPIDTELCLMVSWYGVEDVGLTSLAQDKITKANINTNFEPSTVKYFLVNLPRWFQDRPLGTTPIAAHYLHIAKQFDSLAQAKEAFDSKETV